MKAVSRLQVASSIVMLAIATTAVLPVWAQRGAGQARGGADAPANQTAGQANRNVQLLKDLPADQLNPTMRFFAYSLGVECQFCHVGGDNASDEKPTKVMARAMIKMVMDLNKNNFGGRTEVTCFTCHRGGEDPGEAAVLESKKIIPGGTAPPAPPAAAGRGGGGGGGGRGAAAAPAPEPPAPALPSADAILAKYVQALGGEQALRKITSRTSTGTFDTASRNDQDIPPWTQGTFELYEKAPNLRTLVLRTPGAPATSSGFDGNSSWLQAANGAVAEDEGRALARVKRAADFYEPLSLKQEYAGMIVRGTDTVNGREAYLVLGVPNGDTPERLYFDVQTGLLVRRQAFTQNSIASIPVQTDYLDYRDSGGVKYPSTIKISDVTATPMYTVLHVNKVDFSTPIDAAKLTKPVSTAPAGRGGGGGAGGGGGRGGGGRGGAQ